MLTRVFLIGWQLFMQERTWSDMGPIFRSWCRACHATLMTNLGHDISRY